MASGWWSSFFDDAYGEYGEYGLGALGAERTERAVQFLVDALELTPGDRVFDQCCGIGRLSLPLAARGFQVVGVDLTASYVEHAQQQARKADVDVEFHQGDAHQFVVDPPCDAAFNWFTSFGYSDDDAVNMTMLARAYESLRPGGRFALDYLNVSMVLSDFQRSLCSVPKEPIGWVVIQRNQVNFERGMIESVWTTIDPYGDRADRMLETRMYLPHQLIEILRTVGFTDVELYGDHDGGPHHRMSPRCVLVAKRV